MLWVSFDLSMDAGNPVLIIAGPTASGKSALAVDAALEFDGTVINADSMQVYRELDILTARPRAVDEARVAHRLFGVLGAADPCSAGRWKGMASVEIMDARSAGRLPIVVGGTGLYLKALTDGLAPVPKIPERFKDEALSLHSRLGGTAFRDKLAELDAETARCLPDGDSQRLIRAYSVARATGRPLSDWHGDATVPAVDARFATIVLAPPRGFLLDAIEARFHSMIELGALDEVASLLALGLAPGLPAMKALGVAELGRHVKGEIGLDEAVEASISATRRFAKRQQTWLRNKLSGPYEVFAQYSESHRAEIFSFIRQFLLTGQT
jgi:tRNA dimethylallyltransferase